MEKKEFFWDGLSRAPDQKSEESLNSSKSTGSDFWDLKGKKKQTCKCNKGNLCNCRRRRLGNSTGALFIGNFTWIPSLHGNIGNGIWPWLGILGLDLALALWGWVIPSGKSIQRAPKDGKNQEEIIEGREKSTQHWNFSGGKIPSGARPAPLPAWLGFYFTDFSDFLCLFPFWTSGFPSLPWWFPAPRCSRLRIKFYLIIF